ncbi:MAG: hypothetical protein J7L53_07915, partial [Deltaproteobacteria bacterium]|nr:hypothetical protein [Deltaproteobacteria bacterium]
MDMIVKTLFYVQCSMLKTVLCSWETVDGGRDKVLSLYENRGQGSGAGGQFETGETADWDVVLFSSFVVSVDRSCAFISMRLPYLKTGISASITL